MSAARYRSSVKARLTRVILSTSLGVLGFTCVTLFVVEVRNYRAETTRSLATAANIIAENSAGVLVFDDQKMASDILGGFRAEPGVSAAALLDRKGNVYATYPNSLTADQFSDARGPDGLFARLTEITVRRPVLQEGARVGTIYVKGTLMGTYQRLRAYGLVIVAVGLCSTALALLLSNLLQRRIARPLGALLSTAQTLSQQKDYSVRAPKFESDEFGELTDAFNSMLDEIQNSSNALRAGEERFRTLADNIAQLAWMTTPDGAITWYNQRWFDYSGSTMEEMKGWGWQKIHHPEHVERVTEKFKRALADGVPWEDIFPLLGKDGRYRWFLSRAFPIRNDRGETVRWFGTNTDITEQRLAQERLQVHASRAEVLSQVAAELFLSESPRSALVPILPRIAKALDAEIYLFYIIAPESDRIELASFGGLTQEQLAGTGSIAFGDSLCGSCALQSKPVVVDDVQNSTLEIAATARKLGIRSYACYPLKSKSRPLGALAFAALNKNRFEAADLHFIHTVTDLVGASMERERLISELREARDTAERANSAKDGFLAALSHELRTPLNPVLLVASEAAADEALDVTVREDFAMIAKNVRVEAHLIDDLLDLTKISRGQLVLDHRSVDAYEILQDAIRLVEPEIVEQEIVLRTDLFPGSYIFTGDPIRIQQVFWNVLKNAVKFSPKRGDVFISSKVDSLKKVLTIMVTDHGIGLTKDELTRVFDAFAQGDHATERGSHRFGGLGLGLAISRTLIQMHGGSLRATSAGRGTGATFTIEVPFTVPKPAAVSNGSDPESSDRGTHLNATILLVEDHAPSRLALAKLLSRRGHNVAAVGSIADALAISRERKFDVVVSDIGLPDGTGYTLMQELRQRFNLKGIALSGYGSDLDIKNGEAVGFVSHLIKPVNAQQLDETLKQVLRGPIRPV